MSLLSLSTQLIILLDAFPFFRYIFLPPLDNLRPVGSTGYQILAIRNLSPLNLL